MSVVGDIEVRESPAIGEEALWADAGVVSDGVGMVWVRSRSFSACRAVIRASYAAVRVVSELAVI
jgi:hypothetical protein